MTTYPNAVTEVEDLGKSKAGGREYHATIRLRPIAYYVDGSPRPITNRLAATGDAAFGLGADELIAVRVASRLQGNAPLWEVKDTRRRAWARLALEGGGVVQGKALDDNAWLFPEALPGADLSISYGGHRVAADFVLRKGHPKVFTWRLDAQGGFDPKALTLGDLTLRQPVLLPPQESPWVLPIPLKWEVRSKGGRYTLTCALPDGDWAGWTLDPTLVIQSDATAGKDSTLSRYSSNKNYGATAQLTVGKYAIANDYIARVLIGFDLTALPDVPYSSVAFSHYQTWLYSTGPDYFRIYRMKTGWEEMQATWNVRSTGEPWTSPGGFDVNDCEQVAISSRQSLVGESSGRKYWSPLPTTKADLDLGYGWLIKADIEANGVPSAIIQAASSDSTTASLRPMLTVTWVEGGGPALASGVFRSGVFGHKMVR